MRPVVPACCQLSHALTMKFPCEKLNIFHHFQFGIVCNWISGASNIVCFRTATCSIGRQAAAETCRYMFEGSGLGLMCAVTVWCAHCLVSLNEAVRAHTCIHAHCNRLPLYTSLLMQLHEYVYGGLAVNVADFGTRGRQFNPGLGYWVFFRVALRCG